MTLPASGQISLRDVIREITPGTEPTPGAPSLDWLTQVRPNTKLSVGGPVNVVTNFNELHNLAWYQNTNGGLGNCSNGNCATSTNSGNKQCENCYPLATVNCAIADPATYLQPNCNCNCTFNCSQVANQTFACDCDCWICNCACW